MDNYEKQIDEIKMPIANSLENQISIAENTFNLIKKNSTVVRRQIEAITNHVETIGNHVNGIEWMQAFMSTVLLIKLHLQQGHLNWLLLTPVQLHKQLKIIHNNIPRESSTHGTNI